MEVSVARVGKVLRSTLGHGSECWKACVMVTGVRGRWSPRPLRTSPTTAGTTPSPFTAVEPFEDPFTFVLLCEVAPK